MNYPDPARFIMILQVGNIYRELSGEEPPLVLLVFVINKKVGEMSRSIASMALIECKIYLAA